MLTTRKVGVFRTGVVLSADDQTSLEKIQQALVAQRGGEVSLSDAIREAIRFRAKQLKATPAKA